MLRRRFLGSLLLFSPLLAGCGFQLRGGAPLSSHYSPMFVQFRPGSRIGPALLQDLHNTGSELTLTRSEARSIVRILVERQDQRVTAVDSSGKVIGIELIYQVAFDAIAADGSQLAARQELVLTREYVNPEVEVIAKAEEAELLRRDLTDDMADRILRRLQAQLL